jgi:hypothetical protein
MGRYTALFCKGKGEKLSAIYYCLVDNCPLKLGYPYHPDRAMFLTEICRFLYDPMTSLRDIHRLLIPQSSFLSWFGVILVLGWVTGLCDGISSHNCRDGKYNNRVAYLVRVEIASIF